MSRRRKQPSRRPGAAPATPTATDAVKVHVIKILEACAGEGEARDAKIAEIEAAGGQIVSIGQTGEYDGTGKCPWEITDWRTGKTIASGTNSFAEFGDAIERLDPDGRWTNIDQLGGGIDVIHATPTKGVPPSLATALEDWAWHPKNAEEVAAFVGWPVAEVLRCVETDEEEA